jgi:hypothetical protein
MAELDGRWCYLCASEGHFPEHCPMLKRPVWEDLMPHLREPDWYRKLFAGDDKDDDRVRSEHDAGEHKFPVGE